MILETSWEVCNKMGGIYTVLSSRADIMTQHHPDQVVFIGPLLTQDKDALPLDFIDAKDGWLGAWCRDEATKLDLRVRVGRWAVAGEPPVVLVDFHTLEEETTSSFGCGKPMLWRVIRAMVTTMNAVSSQWLLPV